MRTRARNPHRHLACLWAGKAAFPATASSSGMRSMSRTPRLSGWWHTGENWYLDFDGNSAGAPVYAVADGTVVFAGSDYPGRVVIIQHEGGIYSMYGHLDYALLIGDGDSVTRGQLIAGYSIKPMADHRVTCISRSAPS